MHVIDSVYGPYDLPNWIQPLVKSPIIQRLRWVALSNIPSLTYPMISGITRYAHSMGVANLANILSLHLQLTETESRSLVCAALLHDAGMPPLGHLTEEALDLLGINYDHEESLKIVLLDEGKRFHPMPDGEKVGVIEAIYKIHSDSQQIFDIIIGKGVMGKYLASQMDIDNIDNVIRLFRLIFPREIGYLPEDVTKDYFSNASNAESQKHAWREARKTLYTKLMFSIEDFAQKATIKRMVSAYMANEINSLGVSAAIDSIRFLNDHQFLSRIVNSLPKTSNNSFFSGKFDRVVTFGWIDAIDEDSLNDIRATINDHNKNYYLDFIPDKRFKDTQKDNERGALIGIFCSEKDSKKNDSELIEVIHGVASSFKESFTPAMDEENQQLSFI